MSGASARRKGHDFERALVRWFRDHGWVGAERRPSGLPGGDLTGVPVHVEAKNHKAWDLAAWTAQAAGDASGRPWVVIVKRRGTTEVGDSYAVTSLAHFTDLLAEVDRPEYPTTDNNSRLETR